MMTNKARFARGIVVSLSALALIAAAFLVHHAPVTRAEENSDGEAPAKAAEATQPGGRDINRLFSDAAVDAADRNAKYLAQVIPLYDARESLDGELSEAFSDMSLGPYSGVIVGKDGEILIADAILGEFADQWDLGFNEPMRGLRVVLADGRTYDAEVEGRHVPLGFALLKIPASGLPALDTAAAAKQVASGPRVDAGVFITLVTRSHNAYRHGAASGICSRIESGTNEIQFDGRLGLSDLGGLLVETIGGKPLGVFVNNLQFYPTTGLSFVAPMKRVVEALESLRQGLFVNHASPPPSELRFDEREDGNVLVLFVQFFSPEIKAGLKAQDLIVKVNDKAPGGITGVRAVLDEARLKGNEVKLTVERKGERKELTISYADRKESPKENDDETKRGDKPEDEDEEPEEDDEEDDEE